MGSLFESLVKTDTRFEVPAARHLGLVTFRLKVTENLSYSFSYFLIVYFKGENELTEQLLKEINSTGLIHCVPASIKGKYIIRFTVTATSTNAEDIKRDWAIIKQSASKILRPYDGLSVEERRSKMKSTHNDFRMSLVLSNTPHSPCLINGSFAAILPLNTNHIYAMTHELSQRALKNSLMPISTRKRTTNLSNYPHMSKQLSIDGWMISNGQQTKHFVSSTNLSLPISRQASLDSRIEEILKYDAMDKDNNKALNEPINTTINGHSQNHLNVPSIRE